MKKHIITVLTLATLLVLPGLKAGADIKTNRFDCLFLHQDEAKRDSATVAATAYHEQPLKYAPHSDVYNDSQAMIRASKTVKTEKGEQTTEWYLEIPDSVMNRDMLAVARCTEAPAGMGLFGGEEMNETPVYFCLSADKKFVYLKTKDITLSSSTTDVISKAVSASNLDPIICKFKVDSCFNDYYKVSASPLIDDDGALGMPQRAMRNFNFSGPLPDGSYVQYIHSYPTNVEIRTTKTYGCSLPIFAASAEAERVTFGINISLYLLPKEPMQRRIFDPRVGYFTDSKNIFSDSQQKVENQQYIVRWRLEPKNEADAQKQKNGELIEPKKQIVYYIDPATPKQWRQHLIDGVKDWNVAFEQAGWKNAITAMEWPENDSTMSMEDARFSVIRYLATDQANAYGPNVHDYRSGEILESHVGWYHNITLLLHSWYQVQCGAVDPEARKYKFSDELMGKLVRFVSSHEIGHTLGLRHNFGSSNTVPTDSLRSNTFLEKYGHTPSIMDYARFDYVAQPEDNIDIKNLYPRVNDYDKWAIEWGYKPTYDCTDSESERTMLAEYTTKRLAGMPRLIWGNGEETAAFRDPRNCPEDLGDDIYKTAHYFIANLKRILPELDKWNYSNSDMDYLALRVAYQAAMGQLDYIESAMVRNLTGKFYTPQTPDSDADAYRLPTKEESLRYLDYMDEQYFQDEPRWKVDYPYISRFTVNDNDDLLLRQSGSTTNLTMIFTLSSINPNLPINEYLDKIMGMALRDYPTANKPLSQYRKSLIRTHVYNLCTAYNSRTMLDFETVAAVMAKLRELQKTFRSAAAINTDETTRNFYNMLAEEIELVVKIRNTKPSNTITIFFGG